MGVPERRNSFNGQRNNLSVPTQKTRRLSGSRVGKDKDGGEAAGAAAAPPALPGSRLAALKKNMFQAVAMTVKGNSSKFFLSPIQLLVYMTKL